MAHSVLIYEKGYVGGGIELVYDAASQTEYKTTYRSELQTYEPAVLLHEPDYGEAVPVRAYDLDRTFFFELHIKGSSRDNSANALTRLLRWIDGANSPALRIHMLNDAVELRLRVQLDGATNYTDSSIKWGFVDTAGALLSSASLLNKHIRGAVVALHLPPYSEGASISLTNNLSNGDFLVESGTSGLAQDWTLISTPTAALDTSIYLVNGVSQHISSAGSGTGLRSNSINVNNGISINAFVWVYLVAGTCTARIYNNTDASTLDSATIDSSGTGADLTIIDRNGNRWYRYPLSGTNSTGSAKDYQLQVIRATGTAEFYADAAYFNYTDDSTTVPSGGWSSYYSLDNRGDETNANMGRRNWLDLALIPGDAPALVRHKFDTTFGTTSRLLYMGRVFDGKALAAAQRHWIESDEFGAVYTSDVNGAWTTSTGTSDNHFYRYTASGGTGSSDRYAGFSGQDARDLLRTPRRVFARVRSSSTNTTFTFSTASPTDIQQANTVSVTTANTWELVDLGTMNGLNVLPDDDGSEAPSGYPIMSFIVAVAAVPNGGTADFDAFWLPWTTEFLTVKTYFNWTTGESMWVDGWQRGVIQETSGQFEPNTLGTMWEAVPGLRSNRYTLATAPANNAHTLTDAYTFTVDIIPRTRQLLGTV